MKVKAKMLLSLLGRTLVVLPMAGFSSCELVKDDLAECPTPAVELRFVYDYNLESANSFHKQVDCLSAYFFDSDGRLVSVEQVTDRALLSDEDYRMRPDLPAGTYHVVAYGGMDCEKASFSHVGAITAGDHYTSLHVQLNPECLTAGEAERERRRLHNHYYGAADFTVDAQNDTRATVEMMRNTNSVQVALQHVSGSPIDCNDFIFAITDDNNDFDHANNLLATGEITYKPWNTENRSTGTVGRADSDTDEWHTALAQFTTSRLVTPKPTSAMLHVLRAEVGDTVLRVPLINYMLLFKNENTDAGLGSMGDQEYLDRANSWNFLFFLDDSNGESWDSTRIMINDWEVRFNEPQF